MQLVTLLLQDGGVCVLLSRIKAIVFQRLIKSVFINWANLLVHEMNNA